MMKIQKFFEINPYLALQESYFGLSRIFEQQAANEGLNVLQSFILISLLFDSEKEIRPKDLVNALRSSKSTISQALSILEYKKLIKRQLNNQDARSYSLSLTAEGKTRANRLAAFFDQFQKDLEKVMNEADLKNIIKQLHLISG